LKSDFGGKRGARYEPVSKGKGGGRPKRLGSAKKKLSGTDALPGGKGSQKSVLERDLARIHRLQKKNTTKQRKVKRNQVGGESRLWEKKDFAHVQQGTKGENSFRQDGGKILEIWIDNNKTGGEQN